MSAIITALQSVTQRPSTFAFVHGNKLQSEKLLLHQLGEVLNPLGSHKKYHEALQDIKPPTFAIPWLGVSSLPPSRRCTVSPSLGFSESKLMRASF
jgi:hypothetical protein